ncbi:MAG TPA: hypothetical protein VF988_04550, partial [Verrucomicrobiae bacterium]
MKHRSAIGLVIEENICIPRFQLEIQGYSAHFRAMRLTHLLDRAVLMIFLMVAYVCPVAAQSKGVIPEIRVGTDTYRNVEVLKRMGNKVVISHSGGVSGIDIASLDDATRARLGIAGTSAGPVGPITGLILTNQGGTHIAKGHSLFLTATNSTCHRVFQGHTVILRFEHADGDVELWFGGPEKAYLHPGHYENARDYGHGPFPMMTISSDGTSLEGTGNFNVTEATYVGDKVSTFHATFDFTADNADGQVRGEVYYQANAVYPTEVLSRVATAASNAPRYTALMAGGGPQRNEPIVCVASGVTAKVKKERNGGWRFSFNTQLGAQDI